LKTQTLMGT